MKNWIALFESNLDSIQRLATKLGVHLEVDEDFGKIYLVDIRRNAAPAGSGATVLQALTRYADENDLDILLDAENGSEGLIAYYEQFGFELEDNVQQDMDEDGENYQGPWTMWRIPKI